MAYYIDLFSPETYEAFTKSSGDISGFRLRQENAARRIRVGDKLICYMTKVSRWFGILEVKGNYFRDNTPLFYSTNDPFEIRFKVKKLVWLPVNKAIPIHDEEVWKSLSFTKGVDKNSAVWTGKVRTSLNRLDDSDGIFLESLILKQTTNDRVFPIDKEEYKKYLPHKIRSVDSEINVSVPQEDNKLDNEAAQQRETRESIKIQALLAKIGAAMGLKIWLPRMDRSNVLREWKHENGMLIDTLPLNYDEATLKTVEQIDVIWLRGRSIVRAFEIEHTTSIYSGLLRMADLLALQPNMNIKLHIVSPYARREKVFQEINRPVFSLLEGGPLSIKCTYLSYDSVEEIGQQKHLNHLSDTVLDDYTEDAE